MSDKSHVSLEQQVCVVCCAKFDTSAILLHKQLRPVLDHKTVTGWGMCPEHQKLKDEGYVALVAIDEAKSRPSVGHHPQDSIQPDDAYRLGAIVHLRTRAWVDIFNVPVPPKGVAFVEQGVIDYLTSIQHHDDRGSTEGASTAEGVIPPKGE
jgi:hypothetical protein